MKRRASKKNSSSVASQKKKEIHVDTDKANVSSSSYTYPQWHNLVAGAAAGAGARLITAPLDLLKIRRQLQHSGGASGVASAAAANVASSSSSSAAASVSAASRMAMMANKYSPLGMFTSLRRIAQTEGGLPSLFRGNLAATYLWIGYAAVQFSLYAKTSECLTSFHQNYQNINHNIQQNLPPLLKPLHPPIQTACNVLSQIGSHSTTVAFCSGAAAGTAATLATYPFDICRTAFASQKTLSQGTKSITAFFGQAMKNNPHPFKTLYAGSVPATIGIVPYMGLNFAIYDYLVHLNRGKGGKGSVQVMDAGAAGAIAGGTSKFLVYPLDTVKKRLQAQAFESFWGTSASVGSASSASAHGYKHMADCVMRIAKEEGVGAFYRGLVPTVVKTMTATSVTFAIFTLTKNSLESVHDYYWARNENNQE